jgi:hypothetical protein
MGCGQSTAVDFSELDMARSEKQNQYGSSSPMNHSSGPMVSLAQIAKPVMDHLVLAESTPKLSKQI